MENIKLSQVIKKHLKQKGKSIRQAAIEMGMSQSTLNQICQGRPTRRLDYIIKIASYLEISLDELVLDKPNPPVDIEKLAFSEFFDGLVRLRIDRVITTKNKKESK